MINVAFQITEEETIQKKVSVQLAIHLGNYQLVN